MLFTASGLFLMARSRHPSSLIKRRCNRATSFEPSNLSRSQRVNAFANDVGELSTHFRACHFKQRARAHLCDRAAITSIRAKVTRPLLFSRTHDHLVDAAFASFMGRQKVCDQLVLSLAQQKPRDEFKYQKPRVKRSLRFHLVSSSNNFLRQT